jgi:hypothetical protein
MYCKSGNNADAMPANPAGVREKQWKGIIYWLGTTAIAYQDTVFKPSKEARSGTKLTRRLNRIGYTEIIVVNH